MERTFKRSYSALDELFHFLDGILEAENVGEDDAFTARLALEEVFTNMVKYSTSKISSITVRIQSVGNDLVLELEDQEAESFDPVRYPAPDLKATLEERRPGGLGLHLVRSLVDSIDHDYVDRRNIVTLRIKLAR